jgi:hypothetical protein
MRAHRNRLVLAGLGASLLLAMAVGTASANRLSVRSQAFSTVWTPLSFSFGGAVIRCNVTLSGSFESTTISKVAGRIGAVTGASANTCSGATVTVLTETLPWDVNYVSFAGTLPRISSIRVSLVGARFAIDPEGALPACLVGTTATYPAFGIAHFSGGTVTGLRADETVGLPFGGSFICEIGGDGFFAGTGAVENTAGASITVTLI